MKNSARDGHPGTHRRDGRAGVRRRAFVAGTASVAAIGGCLDDVTGRDDGSGDGDEDDVDDSPPFEVRTVDAPGSEAGTLQVPTDGRVMLLNFTRLFCPTSEGLLSNVDEAQDSLEDATVVSVVDGSSGPQPTPAELADWWAEQDGNWTVGIDERGLLNDHYDVAGFPVLVAIDGDGEVHWREDGPATPREMVSGVETALAAAD